MPLSNVKQRAMKVLLNFWRAELVLPLVVVKLHSYTDAHEGGFKSCFSGIIYMLRESALYPDLLICHISHKDNNCH